MTSKCTFLLLIKKWALNRNWLDWVAIFSVCFKTCQWICQYKSIDWKESIFVVYRGGSTSRGQLWCLVSFDPVKIFGLCIIHRTRVCSKYLSFRTSNAKYSIEWIEDHRWLLAKLSFCFKFLLSWRWGKVGESHQLHFDIWGFFVCFVLSL